MICADLFSGGGGATAGLASAGHVVAWAANHCPVAVATHAANHPGTLHVCQDLMQADFTQIPYVDLLWASPCCQGHSKARGKKNGNPAHDASRSTAWAVLTAAEAKRPRVVVVENVVEFREWVLYPAWRAGMHALGYHDTVHILDAADFGVPQRRIRLFVVWALGGPLKLDLGAPKKHRPIADVLDFDSGRWSSLTDAKRPKPIAKSTRQRIASGLDRFPGEPFLICYYGSGSGLIARGLHRPVGTLTTRARWGLVDPANNRMRMFTKAETRDAAGFAKGYKMPKTVHATNRLIGNAVAPPVAAALSNAIQEAA